MSRKYITFIARDRIVVQQLGDDDPLEAGDTQAGVEITSGPDYIEVVLDAVRRWNDAASRDKVAQLGRDALAKQDLTEFERVRPWRKDDLTKALNGATLSPT